MRKNGLEFWLVLLFFVIAIPLAYFEIQGYVSLAAVNSLSVPQLEQIRISPVSAQKSTFSPEPVYTVAPTTALTPELSTPTRTISIPTSNNSTFILNEKTKKAHTPNCSYLPKAGVSRSTTVSALISAGYEPCEHCKPW